MAALTKKEQKAQRFRKGERKEKQEKATEQANSELFSDDEKPALELVKSTSSESGKADKNTTKRKADETTEGEPKKRKTRRGKKGKGVNGGKGPRFILFVGNLPYDVTTDQLSVHFKSCKPDRIRIRADKGIAFMEFDNDTKEIQHKMGVALGMHHSTMGNRKINVELTVGGGGNSETRVTKLKEKNEKARTDRKDLMEKKKKETKVKELTGVHPARAALMK